MKEDADQFDALLKEYCNQLEAKGVKFIAAFAVHDGEDYKFNVIHGNCTSEELRMAGTSWCWAIEEEICNTKL